LCSSNLPRWEAKFSNNLFHIFKPITYKHLNNRKGVSKCLKKKLISLQETETTPGEDNTPGDDTPGDDNKKASPITFEMRMENFRSSLQNALDDLEFRQFMDGYGYGEARINVGMAKLHNTSRAEQVKKDKKAQQHKATEIYEEKRLKAHETFIFCVASTRLAYKNDQQSAIIKSFFILCRCPKWKNTVYRIEQIQNFFKRANPGIRKRP
jgi:hypothetical protein